MNIQDIINGCFETLGAPFIILNVIKLYKHKLVRGVSLWHPVFFGSWSIWNLYYYPHLEQWFSFIGGIFISISTIVWLIMLVYYTQKEKIKNLNYNLL